MKVLVTAALAVSLAGCAKADGRADAGPGFSDGALLPDAGIPADAGPDAEPHRNGDLVINEFVADHASFDECEYVEITGAPATDYSQYTLITVEGDSGTPGQVQAVIPIGTTSAGGLWVSGFLMDQLQNGSSTLLLVADFAGGTPDIDGNDDGAIDNEPWSAIVDAVAINDGGISDRTYAQTAVLTRTFDGGSSVVGGASRIPDGSDTDQPGDWVRNLNNAADLPCASGDPSAGEAANTPGESNHI